MAKIDVKGVKLKNFLSYGNTETDIRFKQGINIILGEDKDKDRSNGAGKSSILESIPFALFGQITKGVPLAKIINWKNQKKCEVSLDFTVGDTNYTIFRGIKPGVLELFENGNSVPILSDKRSFQREIEEDILGMDFKAFTNIIFQNANNNISMFTTPAAEKRRFIENFFNLSLYSKLNDTTNKKISGINQKISEIDLEINFKTKRLLEIQSEISNITVPNIDEYQKDVDKIKKELDLLYKSKIDTEESITEQKVLLSSYEDDLSKLSEKKEYIITESGKISGKISALKSENISLEKRLSAIGDIDQKKDMLSRLKSALQSLEKLDEDESKAKRIIEGLQSDINEENLKKNDVYASVRSIDAIIKSLPDPKTLKDKAECPVCLQDCDYDSVKSHVEEKKNCLLGDRQKFDDILKTQTQKIKDLEFSLQERKLEIDGIQENIKKRSVVEKKIAELSNIDEKEKEIEDVNIRQSEIEDELSQVQLKLEEYDSMRVNVYKEIETLKAKIDDIKKEISEIEKSIQYRISLEKDLSLAEKILETKKRSADDIIAENQTKVLSVDVYNNEIEELKESRKKKESILDYLNFIKSTLKDENVKQYAISNMMPFLQSKTNEYLSETGHSYYVELDNWMEGTIRGAGVGECDFGNMSGGEGKSIDMALKFAMMDVARLQAGSYPDILVFDELLDSSIDSYGLEKMVDIIKIKQRDDNLKVFIVSHREEMGEFGYDTLYKVSKENGFSTIMEV